MESQEVGFDQKSWVQRKGFSDWSVALFWVISSFILFQLVGGLVAAILFISTSGSIPSPDQIMSQTGQFLDFVFVGNSTGQILFLALGTLLVTRLHLRSDETGSFLRFQKRGQLGQFIGIAVLLMVVIQPAIWFLSWINMQIPIPESVFKLEQMQTEMIESYLSGDHSLALTLIHVALVPAVCEEILFRGYLLRSFQNSWGIKAAIIGSSLIFGVFHLRFMQVIPLIVIGLILGYLTWRSKSIYPAMAAHLVNNGGSVIVLYAFPQSNFAEMSPESMPPLGLVLASFALSGYLFYVLYRYSNISSAL
jgi:membrane protease YdiL (CAAX protease family)